jgi:hypothetical protein
MNAFSELLHVYYDFKTFWRSFASGANLLFAACLRQSHRHKKMQETLNKCADLN